MSLSNALFNSVSGLDTTSTAISVIGDNIANASTPGFKERRAEFADVLGQTISTGGGFSQTGAGAKLARVSQIFSQGTFETTNRATDMAVEGRGFFAVDGARGRQYTRAGIFNFDNQGTLVDKDGSQVQGFAIDPVTQTVTGQLGPIQLTLGVSPPQASSTVDISAQLDAAEPINGPFDPSNPNATSSFQTASTVFDSLGGPHSSTLYFTRTGVNSWTWNATLPTSDTTDPPATPGDNVVIEGGGTMTFDASGNLTALTGPAVTYNVVGGAAAGQVVNYNFGPIAGVGSGTPTTQFLGTSSTVNSLSTNGFAPGTLQNIVVDGDGFISGTFSNGETLELAQVALATFANVEGLASVGNNSFIVTRASGQPLLGAPRSGQLGAIRSSSLEQSNVDIATQFVKLILNQRAFQANTRTVSTTNQLLANVVQLGQ